MKFPTMHKNVETVKINAVIVGTWAACRSDASMRGGSSCRTNSRSWISVLNPEIKKTIRLSYFRYSICTMLHVKDIHLDHQLEYFRYNKLHTRITP
jgi:hypothetical protein